MATTRDARWILLIHQIPPKPDYFRVKIWRRVQRVGAVAIKNSVYILPANDQTQEDFQWISREIIEGKGDAYVCEATFVEGLSDTQVEALFNTARDADYSAIANDAGEILKSMPMDSQYKADRRSEIESATARLRKRLGEVAAIDFFDSSGRRSVEQALDTIESRLRSTRSNAKPKSVIPGRYRRRVWVTRKGLHIDRMGSAWLIRRFI